MISILCRMRKDTIITKSCIMQVCGDCHGAPSNTSKAFAVLRSGYHQLQGTVRVTRQRKKICSIRSGTKGYTIGGKPRRRCRIAWKMMGHAWRCISSERLASISSAGIVSTAAQRHARSFPNISLSSCFMLLCVPSCNQACSASRRF